MGSDAGVPNYAWMSLYDMNQNGNSPALFRTQYSNQKLNWESSASLGAALEGRILGKANFMVEYFDKQSHNLIFDVNLPLSAGATTSANPVSATRGDWDSSLRAASRQTFPETGFCPRRSGSSVTQFSVTDRVLFGVVFHFLVGAVFGFDASS